MKFLIVFESVEGQTKKVAKAIQEQLLESGHDVRTFDAADRLASFSVGDADRVILAAPVHERRHPEGFEVLLSTSRDELRACPTLLISVSLKAAVPEGMEEAQDYLTEMEMRTKFKPDRELLLAGAVRTGSYSYYETQIVQNVALEGRYVELVDGEREFTDWNLLHNEIDYFQKPPR